MQFISYLIVPCVLALVGSLMLFGRRDLFGEFTQGAKEGLGTALGLLPSLAALICAISMFSASGAADALSSLLEPLLSFAGIPAEIVPLVSIRPFTGGGATAMLSSIYDNYGADSFIGQCASVVAGSSDTIVYMLGVYFSAAGVRKTRGALPAALITMLFCVVFACFLVRVLL